MEKRNPLAPPYVPSADVDALTDYANQWLSAVGSLCNHIRLAERLLGEQPSFVVSAISEERREGIREALLQGIKSEAFVLYIIDDWQTLFRLANNPFNWAGRLSDEVRRTLYDAEQVVRLAVANELQPIRFRDYTAMTAHEAVSIIGREIDSNSDAVVDWDSDGPSMEWERQRDCRRLIKKTADVTPDLLRELEARIEIENLKTKRFLLDQAGTNIKVSTDVKTPLGPSSVWEANKTAMELTRKDPLFVNGGVRDWAEAIRLATGKTCSVATVKETQLWQETMKTTGRGKTKGGRPKAVAFTENVEAVVGEGRRHEALESLIEQQRDDYEPSPLDDLPDRKVRQRKRV